MFALLATATLSFGCSFGEINPKDPFKRKFSLEEAQHQYTALVRWSEFEKASTYVDSDLRDAYVRNAPSLRSVRITDYETGPLDIDKETGAATVDVTYFVYQPQHAIEIQVTESQYWARDGITNNWKVRPTFKGLAELEAVGVSP
jgi:hypothetical protein